MKKKGIALFLSLAMLLTLGSLTVEYSKKLSQVA